MSASLELWPSSPRRTGPPTRFDKIRRNFDELPCALLLAVQLLALLVYPFLEKEGEFQAAGRAVFGVIGLLVLLLAVRAVRATPAHTWIAASMAVPVVVLTVAEAVVGEPFGGVAFASNLAHTVFYFYTGFGLLRYMFADNWVTRDELFATGATFTVVAWGFAYLYAAVQFVWQDSFTIYGVAEPGMRTWFELLYLSITTMTSTGLSDIYAVTPHARSFVLLQQITGMLYVALVVARLVGLTIARFK